FDAPALCPQVIVASVYRDLGNPRLKGSAQCKCREREERLGEYLLGYVLNHIPPPEEAADDAEHPRAVPAYKSFKTVIISRQTARDQLIFFAYCAFGPALMHAL